MKVEIQEEWFSVEQCRLNPNKLYIFGDNMMRKGTGGQACIRHEINSFGIATKRLPSMAPSAFFSDQQDEFESLLTDIFNLYKDANINIWHTIVLPKDGLGTGLSKMPEKSPELFKWMNDTLSKLLNVEYMK